MNRGSFHSSILFARGIIDEINFVTGHLSSSNMFHCITIDIFTKFYYITIDIFTMFYYVTIDVFICHAWASVVLCDVVLGVSE